MASSRSTNNQVLGYSAGSSIVVGNPPIQSFKLDIPHGDHADIPPSSAPGNETPVCAPQHSSKLVVKANRLKKAGCSASSSKESSLSCTAQKPPEHGFNNMAPNSPGSPKPPRPDAPIASMFSRSRPVPLRTHSYSKRHASFDTPREVPMPPYSPGIDFSTTVPTFEDSDRDDRLRERRHTREASRFDEPTLTGPNPSLDGVGPLGLETNNAPEQPQLVRNNSAPTPPALPSERVDRLSFRRNHPSSQDSINRAEDSSAYSGSGSEHQSPNPRSVITTSSEGMHLGRNASGGDAMLQDPLWRQQPSSSDVAYVFSDDRLSTVSLPLPPSHGVQKFSCLPTPARSNADDGIGPPLTKGLSTKAEDLVDGARSGVVEARSSPANVPYSPLHGTTYRASFPLTADYGHKIPVPTQQNSSSRAKHPNDATVPPSGTQYDRRGDGCERSNSPLTRLPEIEPPKSLHHSFASEDVSASQPMNSLRPNQKIDNAVNLISTGDMYTPGDRRGMANDTSTAYQSHSTEQGENVVTSPTFDPTRQTQTQETSQHTNSPLMTVDTTASTYTLEVSLPGYERDEITLSTRKKRVLHIVADGFVSGGGHFERRVSFGYDADMVRVRAEFNGSLLKITVPRRPISQVTSLGSLSSTTPFGGIDMLRKGRSSATS
ncbi:hypothetical protein FRC17_001715 [Serendipita sp. 399]|nr:hypothetical protein FRC17_001715 [Serendipita sp. 399]